MGKDDQPCVFMLSFSGKAIYPKNPEHNEHKHKSDIKLLFSVDFPSNDIDFKRIWVLG